MLHDLTQAWRSLTRRPLFLAIAVLTLGVGIGLNTALFSVANVMLLKPLPVRDGGALVWISSASTKPDGPRGNMTYPDVVDLASVEGLDGASAYGFFLANIATANQAARLDAQAVMGNFFDLLGLTAHRGRLIQPQDDSLASEPVAVIGYAAWQRLFGGRNDAIGQVVRVNGQPFTLVGVAPRLFHGVDILEGANFWVPITRAATVSREVGRPLERTTWWLKAFGRLSAGADRTAVVAALRGRAAGLAQAFPDSHDGFTVAVDPLRGAAPDERGKVAPLFALLLGVTMTVLLIACANVANLLVVRGMSKGRETAIRTALGATRWRLLRYEMIETAILSAAGGACGLLLSLWATDALLAFAGVSLDTDLSPDGRVLLFTLAVSVIAAISFGLLPALRSSSCAPAPALKSEQGSADARPRARVQTLLVAGQLALSMVLLTAAALFLKSLVSTGSVDVGFDPAGRVSMSFNLRMQGYTTDRANGFYRALLDRVHAQPGVRAATLARRVPLGGVVELGGLTFPDRRADPDAILPRAAVNYVWPGFFETMGIPILRGRAFTESDLSARPSIAIVSETFVQKHWPDRDPIGQRFSFNGTRGPMLEVVGVARNVATDEFNEDPTAFAYLPGGAAEDDIALLAWVDGDPAAALRALEAQVRALDGGVAVFAPKTLAAHVTERMDGERGLGRILSVTGLTALALAAIGLYGVIAYTVVRRRREIGVRLALGARPGDVVRLFVLDAGRLAILGVICGLPPALGVNALLAGNLVGVRVADPAAIGAVVVVLGTASLLAAYLPARRAAGVDPIVALRTE
jgi:predicted permease